MKPYFLFICLLLTACSGLPPTIEDPPALDLAYNTVIQAPDRYKNMPVRWGGVIAEVENEQNASLVQVLLYPLNHYGRPMLDEKPEGRFVVKSAQFLDPLVYAKNDEITVAGTISGTIERVIGKKTMTLPLVSLTTLHLWSAYIYNNYYGGYGGYYGGYGYGGFGFPYYYNPFPFYGWRGGPYPYW